MCINILERSVVKLNVKGFDLSYFFTLIFFLGIGKVLSLEKLDVCNNFLKILPPAIGQLKSLTSLHLAYNQLSFLPQGRHVKKLSPLTPYPQRVTFRFYFV